MESKSTEEYEESTPKKKQKVFAAKQFRKQLNSNDADKATTLQQFLNVINNEKHHDYIFDYLESGGNCLELLQTLEGDSKVTPTTVFNIVTKVLLKINAKYPKYIFAAKESCKYLLNTYIAVIHKMLGLSSSKAERKACLKLLTALAIFSSNLAKDVLINVKFHTANFELLTKHVTNDNDEFEEDSVRDAFIHFLTAFLVDGTQSILMLFLERAFLLTSVISGLQFDKADVVCVLVSAMKSTILENGAVSKTVKMSVFSTPVVKNIVNLYNWKGPNALAFEGKNKTFEVDKYEKSKVSECVHAFLLVLCTSHKLGVIFRDPLVGLGRKYQNSLMYTVIDSLDRPWEHSYASDLVIKIIKACPDLTRNLWTIVKPFLEPRLTEKWLNAMKFAGIILEELQVDCMEACTQNLNTNQLAQLLQNLVAPQPVIKTLVPDPHAKFSYENSEIKHQISKLLFNMLNSLERYLNYFQNSLLSDDYALVKHSTSIFIMKNFPNAKILLNEWENADAKYLETVFDILNVYKHLAPQLFIDNIDFTNLHIKEFLNKFDMESDNNNTLSVKIIGTLFDADPSEFSPQSDLFRHVFPIVLQFYYKNHTEYGLNVLKNLLKYTGIFENFYEIDFWVNAILNIDNLEDSSDIYQVLVDIVEDTCTNLLKYQEKLSQYDLSVESANETNIIEYILNLTDELIMVTNKSKLHRQTSPLILGFLTYFNGKTKLSKSMCKYFEFVLLNLIHTQNKPVLSQIFNEYVEYIPSHILNYFNEQQPLKKLKGSFQNMFKTYSDNFITSNLEDFFNTTYTNQILYPNIDLNLLQMSLYYITTYLSTENKEVYDKCISNFDILIDNIIKTNTTIPNSYFETIFENNILIKHFKTITLQRNHNISSTEFIVSTINKLKHSKFINKYLEIYKNTVYNEIMQIIAKKKYKKITATNNNINVLSTVNLDYNQCKHILEQLITDIDYIQDNKVVHDILNHCLERISDLCNSDVTYNYLTDTVIKSIIDFAKVDIDKFVKSIHKYLTTFPRQISLVSNEFYLVLLLLNSNTIEHIELAKYLLEHSENVFKKLIECNLDTLVDKKHMLLPLTQVLLKNFSNNEQLLKSIYDKLEQNILKALQKPQKVGQNMRNNDMSLMVEKFLCLESFNFNTKVHKFEVTEVFHVKLLSAVFRRYNNELSDQIVNNVVMTFVYLQMNLLKRFSKSGDGDSKLKEVSCVFDQVLDTILSCALGDFKLLSKAEILASYYKFCLKFGVSGESYLLSNLRKIIKVFGSNFDKTDAETILDMLVSHSEFLDVVLPEYHDLKFDVLSLFSVLCEQWNEFMCRNQVPVLLAAYNAKLTACDRIILKLLKLYDSKSQQTRFHDFKPFLWGRAAAAHYSVRNQIDTALIRQPKTGDVLNLLKEDLVHKTILNFPRNDDFQFSETNFNRKCYDLMFLLPLFSHLLAPEQQVQTYKFSRSGALCLTVLGLCSEKTQVRQASCYVLSRFHFHLEALQQGKDSLLWITFVEAVCKGTAALPHFKLNNFAANFLSNMALILTRPQHIMYPALSRYLGAKSNLDFSTVPELYTLLHSSEVNFKEHRTFTLELLKNGLKTDKDFADFERSMAFKLISELLSSCVPTTSEVDNRTQVLILEIFEAICNFSLGVKVLVDSHSFLAQLDSLVYVIVTDTNNDNCANAMLPIVVRICLRLAQKRADRYSNRRLSKILLNLLSCDNFQMNSDTLNDICECLMVITRDNKYPELIDSKFSNVLFAVLKDKLNVMDTNRFCYCKLLFYEVCCK